MTYGDVRRGYREQMHYREAPACQRRSFDRYRVPGGKRYEMGCKLALFTNSRSYTADLKFCLRLVSPYHYRWFIFLIALYCISFLVLFCIVLLYSALLFV